MKPQMQAGQLFRGVKEALRTAAAEAPEHESGGGIHWLVLILAMAASAWAAVRLGQDVNFDVLNYHYYDGFAFLHKPFSYDFAPAQVQSFFNPLMHALSYLLLSSLPGKIAAVVLGAVQGINCYLVFQISETLFRRWRAPYRHILSLGNAAAGFYGAASLTELGTTFGDNLVSIMTLTGLLLLLRWLSADADRPQKSRFLPACSGAIIGIAFGLKLTVVTYVTGVSLALLTVLLLRRNRTKPLVAFYGCLALGFLAAYGFWGAHLYSDFRNPVFPYLNSVFRSPYYAPENTMDLRFLPRNLEQTLFYPFFLARKNHLASEIQFRDARLALCYAAVILLAGFGLLRRFGRAAAPRDRSVGPAPDSNLLFLTLFLAISYLAWQQLFSIYRYLAALELLAPTFLALALARLIHSRSLVLGLSLLLNMGICRSVIPADFGRQKFDDGFLRVRVPPVPGIDRSVILMVNDEPTSYVIPSFPRTTRFVRISSNFLSPGQNRKLEEIITGMLAPYDDSRTFVYLANPGEKEIARADLAFYGKELDDRSCWEIDSSTGNKGYLCRTRTLPRPETRPAPAPPPKSAPSPISVPSPATVPIPPATRAPAFVKQPQVGLEVIPSEIQAGRDTVQYHVIGLKAEAVDILYSIDGKQMPPIRKWALPAQNIIRIFANGGTRRGLYHFIGIRDSAAADPNQWIELDVYATVR